MFYDGRLLDGPNVQTDTVQAWHENPMFGPYRFFDVHTGREQEGRNHSLNNRVEAAMAVNLYDRLLQDYGGSFDFANRVGVVTMFVFGLFAATALCSVFQSGTRIKNFIWSKPSGESTMNPLQIE